MNKFEVMNQELNLKLRKIAKLTEMYQLDSNNNALANTIWKMEIEAQQLKETIIDQGGDVDDAEEEDEDESDYNECMDAASEEGKRLDRIDFEMNQDRAREMSKPSNYYDIY